MLSQWSARRDYFDVTQGIRERFHSGAEGGRDKVAVISVRGIILEGDGFVKRQIDRVRQDERVKAVVVRVDSPGGTVTGSDYIYHHLKKLREERNIPLVVSMGSIAASGGYYISMAVGDQEKVHLRGTHDDHRFDRCDRATLRPERAAGPLRRPR